MNTQDSTAIVPHCVVDLDDGAIGSREKDIEIERE
jgi:hypothetical protein